VNQSKRDGADIVAEAARPKGQQAAELRYGSTRSFMLRTLYSWLTLTILYLGVWPMLVIYADAPSVDPEDTPLGWYQLRLLAPLLTAIVAAWLWRASPVPTSTGARARLETLIRTDRLWQQLLFFLLGTIVVVALFLLVADPGGGLRLLALTLAEAAVIGIIISGYLQGAFELITRTRVAALAAIGLYALTFAMRATLAVAAQTTGDVPIALAAGLIAGGLIGAVACLLRAASGSIVPGILALWLLFLAIGLSAFFA